MEIPVTKKPEAILPDPNENLEPSSLDYKEPLDVDYNQPFEVDTNQLSSFLEGRDAAPPRQPNKTVVPALPDEKPRSTGEHAETVIGIARDRGISISDAEAVVKELDNQARQSKWGERINTILADAEKKVLEKIGPNATPSYFAARQIYQLQHTPGLTDYEKTEGEKALRSRYDTVDEGPPSFWSEKFNDAARGLATAGSGLVKGFSKTAARLERDTIIGYAGGNQFPSLQTLQDKERFIKAVEEQGEEWSAVLWKVANHPELAPWRDDWLSTIVGMGMETIPYITATTLAYIGAGPLGGFAVGSMIEGNSAYRTALDNGVPEETARAIGFWVGVACGAVESIGGKGSEKLISAANKKILKKAVTNRVKNRLMKGTAFTIGTVVEGFEEGIQEYYHITGEQTYRDVKGDEIIRRELVSIGAGMGLGGTARVVSAGARGVTGKAEGPGTQNKPQTQQGGTTTEPPSNAPPMPDDISGLPTVADLLKKTDRPDAVNEMSDPEQGQYDELLARWSENPNDTEALSQLNDLVQKAQYPTYDELLEMAQAGDQDAVQAIQEGRYRVVGKADTTQTGTEPIQPTTVQSQEAPVPSNLPASTTEQGAGTTTPRQPTGETALAPVVWKEAPSVLTGGKPTFWVAETPQGKRWVVWDRAKRQWAVTTDQMGPKGRDKTLGWFDSPEAAKVFAESERAVEGERGFESIEQAATTEPRPLPEGQTEAAPAPKILKIGDEASVLGFQNAIVADTFDADGVHYELYSSNKIKGTGGAIRTVDMDSGNTFTIKKHPSFDAAEAEFKKAKQVTGGVRTGKILPDQALPPSPQGKGQGEAGPEIAIGNPRLETRDQGRTKKVIIDVGQHHIIEARGDLSQEKKPKMPDAKQPIWSVWGKNRNTKGGNYGTPDILVGKGLTKAEAIELAKQAESQAQSGGEIPPTPKPPEARTEPTVPRETVKAEEAKLLAEEAKPEVEQVPEVRKVSRAAERIQEEAIAKDLTASLGDLPTYEKMSMADQARMAAGEIATDYENAKQMAYGQVEPPAGLRPASIYRAVAVKAKMEGDVETLRNLAVVYPQVSEELSRMGQEIKAADVGVLGDPVKAMQDVQKAKEKAVAKRRNTPDIKKEKTKWVKEGKAEIKKKVTHRQSWNEFIASIKC